TVHDTMKELGATVLVETVQGLADGSLKEKPQASVTTEPLKHAPKIFTETCQVNFNKTTDEVFNLIRGLSPYPAAFTFLNGKKLKIFKAEKLSKNPTIATGEFETDKKTYLQFACANGFVKLLDIQLEGKKR